MDCYKERGRRKEGGEKERGREMKRGEREREIKRE